MRVPFIMINLVRKSLTAPCVSLPLHLAWGIAPPGRAAGQRVAFFMRKGADLLSKWVGEAERQLRLLFEEAARQQPAIIFFDEVRA